MKKVIVGKSKGLADAEQCDIHVVSKSFYCNNEVIGLKTQCSKQCKECSNWIKTAFKQ